MVRDKRVWLFAGFLAIVLIVEIFGLHGYLSMESVARNRLTLLSLVNHNYVLSIVLFLAVYVLLVALSLPGSQILTITAGLLFGTYLGATLAVVGATTGAGLLFLAVTRIFGIASIGRPGSRVERLTAVLKADAWSYLLVLRLIPVVPFFAINLAAALVGIPFWTFALTTLFGIVPGALAYAMFGAGMGTMLQAGTVPGVLDLMTPELLLSTGGLATLAIVAIPVRRHIERRAKDVRPDDGDQ